MRKECNCKDKITIVSIENGMMVHICHKCSGIVTVHSDDIVTLETDVLTRVIINKHEKN